MDIEEQPLLKDVTRQSFGTLFQDLVDCGAEKSRHPVSGILREVVGVQIL
jgi:hypothetical protein